MPNKQDISDNFKELLQLMVRMNASDLFITANIPPMFKIHGELSPAHSEILTSNQAKNFAYQLMDKKQQKEFNSTQECNFALMDQEIGRFRVNVFQQKHHVGMVLRKIETRIPTAKELELPDTVTELAMIKRGLVIFVGATGTGKSTTLAAVVGYRNQNGSGHIVTIEDPIEFIHEHDGCVITQREVGVDTRSFEAALKNTLRQAPDVILIGEIRSRETMQHAITFSETGHLCLATLHANNANQALDRIINFFPEDRRNQLLLDLSLNLKAIIAQQLIPSPDHTRRVLALEILLNTPLSAQLIRDGEIHRLKDLMKKSDTLGMQTFDQALFKLFKDNKITYDDALHHADAPNELRLIIKLSEDGGLEKMKSALDEIGLSKPFETDMGIEPKEETQ